MMMAKICIGSGVLVIIGLLCIAVGSWFAMAPDGGGKRASRFLSVGFSSTMIGLLATLACLVVKACLTLFA